MSLRHSLVLAFAALLTVFGALAATFAYVSAKAEAWDMFDLQQRQVARFVGDGRDVSSASATLPPHEQDEDLVVEILPANGAQPIRSRPEVIFPQVSKPGFSEFETGGALWRVYTLMDDGRIVKVGQQIAVRDELAADSALAAALPFLLAIPLSWLVATAIVGAIIRRLTYVTAAVENRTITDNRPIALDHVPQEVKPLVAAMNSALARLQGAMEQQNNFIANAAHELRTPLAALVLQIGNLKRVAIDPMLSERVRDLEAGARRASTVTDQLLRLARQDTGDSAAPKETVHLPDVAKEVIAGLLPLAKSRRVDLGLTRSDDVVALGNSQDYRVLIETIVDNAVRYTPEGRSVDVAIVNEAGQPVVAVSDCGPGIPEHILSRVFDRFFRNAGQDQPGSGLGLSIAKSIADRHGVKIALSNRAAVRGLTAKLTFPAS